MDTIFRRRSIRKYTDQPVSDADIQALLTAAMYAPSAGNQRPWHFIVMRDRATLDAVPEFHPYSGMLRQAPAAICVCADPTIEKFPGYWPQDCASATQTLLLEATDRGLGSVWLGVYPEDARVAGARKLLGVPEHIVPFCIVALGHPAEQIATPDRFDPARIHNDKW